MRAIITRGTGGPEVLRSAELPDPVPGPSEVLIRVAAAGVNRADLLQLQGLHPPPPGAPHWPGLEVSGVIVAVGPGVDGASVGDRVCSLLDGGGYADLALAPAQNLLPVPDGVDLVDAAGLPEAMCTLWSNLVAVAGLDPVGNEGRSALVHGGSGGIGTTAIQLLKAMRATVLVTAGGPDRVARCVDLGADVGIDHRSEDFVDVVRESTGGRGVDVILDVVGAAYLERNVRALAEHGQLVVIGMQKGTTGTLDLGPVLQRWLTIHGTVLRRRTASEKAAIISAVRKDAWGFVERGLVRPVIQARLPLREAAEAHRLMASGEVFGKVVLVP